MLSYYGSPGYAPGYAETEPVGEVVYDGLGNPVGFLPFLPAIASAAAPLLSRALPAVASAAAPLLNRAAQAVGSFFRPPMPPPPSVAAPAIPPPPLPFPSPQYPSPFPIPGQHPTPWPLGWVRRPLPYTGLGPRRLYMRCAVWPGPQGLVPEYAAQMTPPQQRQAWQQWQPQPPAAVPGVPGGGFHHRRRRFRRR